MPSPDAPTNFIRELVDADLASGRHTGVVTRWPPEPNGYPHIGHAKSICLNFGLARDYGGVCHLRFDDSNPTTEDEEYVQALERDVRWLGFDWGDKLFFASDYFGQLYEWALHLVREGKAYVCGSSEEEVRAFRGTVTEPGRPTPGRERPIADNVELFARMRAGEFPDGRYTLRAKIDLASPNMKMRDPVLYRIRHAHHYRQGDAWCIYPMYDFIHPLSDAIEHITHSICTLEFENNRELYDWMIANVPVPARPKQIEFARLNLSYTVMSKRKLLELVEQGHVDGWDDPRMPTLAGMRRRGIRPEAIRAFCDMIGVARNNSTVDVEKLEFCIREDLNPIAPRVMCVLDPLRVVIESWPEAAVEELDAPFFPSDVGKEGSRKLPMSRVVYIERDDFRIDPPKGYHRLAPGREVRLRHGYVIRCERAVTNDAGEVVELVCTHDPATRNAAPADGRKVKGTIHWVSAQHAIPCEVRVYERLFRIERPDLDEAHFSEHLSPESLRVLSSCRIEPSVAGSAPLARFQFERQGYFAVDPRSVVGSSPDGSSRSEGLLVFNRIVALRDGWAKVEAREGGDQPMTPTPPPVARAAKPKTDKPATPPPPKVAKAPAAERTPKPDPGPRMPDADLEPIVAAVIAEFPAEAERYRGGKTTLAGFFVGHVMRRTAGRADAERVGELVRAGLA